MKKIVTLEQVTDTGFPGIKAEEVEEGEKVGDFRVADVQEVECDHPKVKCSMGDQVPEGDPTVKATCQVCGESEEVNILRSDVP